MCYLMASNEMKIELPLYTCIEYELNRSALIDENVFLASLHKLNMDIFIT